MKAQKGLLYWGYHILLFLLVVLVLLPIIVAVGNSVRFHDSEIYHYMQELSPFTFLPKTFTLGHYKRLFSDAQFHIPLKNSLIVSIATVTLGFLVNGIGGYTFAKFTFKGKHAIFLIFLFSFMIPFEVIAVPLYRTCSSFGILNTRAVIILPMIGNGMIVFLYKQFYEDVPDAIIESAKIDGASTLRTYFSIVVPLSVPIIISASLMMFIQQWDAFLWPLVSASSREFKVIQVSIAEFTGENYIDWSLIYSATTLAILIPAVILVPLQKYFIQGVAGTGIKE